MPQSGVRYTGPERRSGERRRHGRRAGRPLSVVIPAMNEADNLPHVFSRLPTFIDEVVLVDWHRPCTQDRCCPRAAPRVTASAS